MQLQSQYFKNYKLESEDARQKYSSRAAQSYKDKLSALSEQAMKVHGTQVSVNSLYSTHSVTFCNMIHSYNFL